MQLANGQDDKSLPAIDIGPAARDQARRRLGGGLSRWTEFNPASAPFDRIVLHAKTQVGGDWVQFDKLVLSRFDPKTADAKTRWPRRRKNVSLQVNCRAPGHAISPYIYGIAGNVSDTGATARRWGGNPTTRYNWQLGNAYNVGKDWFFENATERRLSRISVGQSDSQTGLRADDSDHRLGREGHALGWLSRSPSTVAQQAHDPHRPDAGDGVRPDGARDPPEVARA